MAFSLSPLLSLDYVLKGVMYSVSLVCLLAGLQKKLKGWYLWKLAVRRCMGKETYPLNVDVYSSDSAVAPLLWVHVELHSVVTHYITSEGAPWNLRPDLRKHKKCCCIADRWWWCCYKGASVYHSDNFGNICLHFLRFCLIEEWTITSEEGCTLWVALLSFHLFWGFITFPYLSFSF